MAAEAPVTVYILYNADASVLGKINYGIRKIGASESNSPCSACDLTHGGLRLTESKEWKCTKEKIGVDVQQLHRDQLTPEVCAGSLTLLRACQVVLVDCLPSVSSCWPHDQVAVLFYA